MLLDEASLTPSQLATAQHLATELAIGVRAARTKAAGVDALMLEFSLDSREGIALMCLAEALLRIPDRATRNRLIGDKIGKGDWRAHIGRSPSLFVNAAAWGLLVTGRLVDTHSDSALEQAIVSLLRKGGAPLIHKGVDLAMRLLGKQFVTGRTIEEALSNAREREQKGYRFSYDMLGEAALTADDSRRYYDSYAHAIHAIGTASRGAGIYDGPGISIKLSALHPRYSRLQRERVMGELLPRVARLAALSRGYAIGFNIDAEEAERLDLSLDLFEALAADPALSDWDGLGFVVQAYQKRARSVIDWLADLALRHRRRLMVRLVKGAYWDTEIKRSQVEGLADYPVFTRKVHTDVSYLACARAMLAAGNAIYPQFATHNAFTIAAVHTIAGDADYEFQCLHGMGESVYDQVVGADRLNRAARIYAPVGSHETLLAYLVRRLLENGANTSFVNRIVDPAVSIAELVADPVEGAGDSGGSPHPRIPLPVDLFADRENSRGFDFSDEAALDGLERNVGAITLAFEARPLLGDDSVPTGERIPVRSPHDRRVIVGTVVEATALEAARAVSIASTTGRAWSSVPAGERAACLERAADLLEQARPMFLLLAAREAGKTLPNAIGEIREAADFCRYYAAQARREMSKTTARGPMVCIAPWNFPLAIFVGQVSAALATGNPVLAKPAEQTPLIAAAAIRLLHQAGIPAPALQLVPGPGAIGAALIADPRIAGVLFTGSTNVAQHINRQLASSDADPVLIAETGGQNAMIVDSSALPEQVVADAIASAFDSAGQRCSALRVLCIQDDIADRVIEMLKGAMGEISIGDPLELPTDFGPVIDGDSHAALTAHVAKMRGAGASIFEVPIPAACASGTFFPPTLIEIASISQLEREVFGPVLHVLRFRQAALPSLMEAINATGYGLTHGIQTRIDETVELVVSHIRAGNIYVNRNMVGAVVGVQPFGGEGLSGTGPKAGGPHYLWRLVRERSPDLPADVNAGLIMPGPTGETNTLFLRPRGRIACIANLEADVLAQARLCAALGNVALLARSSWAEHVCSTIDGLCEIVDDPLDAHPDVVLFAGSADEGRTLREKASTIAGALVQVVAQQDGRYDQLRLVCERTVTINTTASGGNASLLSLTEASA